MRKITMIGLACAAGTSYYHYDEKSMKDIPFEYYTMGYDHISCQSTTFYSYEERLTKENYVEQRTQERS